MDPSSQFIVPTIIDVPELIVTNEDIDYDESTSLSGSVWFNKLQFLASALSYTIGLGNLWRFPHLCYKHGGGAFLIAYSLALAAVGLPLFLMELAFGQYANEGPITIWRISPAFEGIGYAMCLISAMVAIYYNIINAWILHYLLASLTFGDLPWSSCDNSWNSLKCFLKPDNVTTITVEGSNCTPLDNGTIPNWTAKITNSANLNDPITSSSSEMAAGGIGNSGALAPSGGPCATSSNESSFDKLINTTTDVLLPANEYFHNNVLDLSPSLSQLSGLNWSLLLGLVLAWSIVFIVTLKNLRPPPRLMLIGLIMPYLALFSLFVRAITLPGSTRGISYYLTPQWERLQNIDIWADATTQIFFALSPCWGGIITLANMNKFHNNFHANAMLIVAINYITSLAVGLVAFSIVGFMSNYSGIAIDKVTDVSLGFVFMVYTEALGQLPLASINSLVFFLILFSLGLNCQLTVIETVITTVVDTWPHKLRYRRPLVLMILCSTMLLMSLIMCLGNSLYLIQVLDAFGGTFTAMIVGLLELVAIAWVYGMENFMQDIDDMISVHRNLFPSRSYWYFMWRYLTPSLLFAVLLFCLTDLPALSYRDRQLPDWTMRLGWTLTAIIVSVIPVMAFIRFLLAPSGSIADKISYLCRPSEDWAPSSYVSGPKLLNRHQMLDDSDLLDSDRRHASIYISQRPIHADGYEDQDQESNESNEDLKVVDGKANYIIPEEEEDTDTGLTTNETNV